MHRVDGGGHARDLAPELVAGELPPVSDLLSIRLARSIHEGLWTLFACDPGEMRDVGLGWLTRDGTRITSLTSLHPGGVH